MQVASSEVCFINILQTPQKDGEFAIYLSECKALWMKPNTDRNIQGKPGFVVNIFFSLNIQIGFKFKLKISYIGSKIHMGV